MTVFAGFRWVMSAPKLLCVQTFSTLSDHSLHLDYETDALPTALPMQLTALLYGSFYDLTYYEFVNSMGKVHQRPIRAQIVGGGQ